MGDIGQPIWVTHGDGFNIGFALDQKHLAIGQLSHGADGFGMAGMANHDHLKAVLTVAFGFDMNFTDQRAGGIDIDHIARLRGAWNGLRHPMRGKNHRAIIRTFVQLLHKYSTLGAQAVDDKFIVHDLMAHKHGCTPFLQSHLYDFYGTIHPRAKTSWRGEIKFELRFCHGNGPLLGTLNVPSKIVQSLGRINQLPPGPQSHRFRALGDRSRHATHPIR